MDCLKLAYQEQKTPLKVVYGGLWQGEKCVQRFLSVDPKAAKFSKFSPYNYGLNNPILMIDPDGRETKTWYVDKDNNVLLHTNDGSNDIVRVPDKKVEDIKYWAANHTSVVDTKQFNDNYKAKFGLSDRQLTQKEVAQLSNLNSEWSRENAVVFFLNPTMTNYLAAGSSEALSQWTNPYLVVGGLTVAVGGVGAVNAAKGVGKFTQSAADDLVIGLKNAHGGNVTVMKNGQPVFRVHQPGTHGNTGSTITKFSQHTNPQGVSFPRPDLKVSPFNQSSFDILNQAINGKGGYSIITKGGR